MLQILRYITSLRTHINRQHSKLSQCENLCQEHNGKRPWQTSFPTADSADEAKNKRGKELFNEFRENEAETSLVKMFCLE